MNTIALALMDLGPSEPGEDPSWSGWYFGVELRIDGTDILNDDPEDNGPAVSLWSLVESAMRDGEHYIFTCSCGDALYAGIFEGVHVFRDADGLHWHPRQRHWRVRHFALAPGQYQAAVEACVREGRRILAGHAPETVRFIPIGEELAPHFRG